VTKGGSFRPQLNALPYSRSREADGDFWKGVTMPKIRLMGGWLERAGFSPGNRVQVTCVAPGVIQLRSLDALTVEQTK
jgi:hypothetical protein